MWRNKMQRLKYRRQQEKERLAKARKESAVQKQTMRMAEERRSLEGKKSGSSWWNKGVQKVKKYVDEAPQRRRAELSRLREEVAIEKERAQLGKARADLAAARSANTPRFDPFAGFGTGPSQSAVMSMETPFDPVTGVANGRVKRKRKKAKKKKSSKKKSSGKSITIKLG